MDEDDPIKKLLQQTGWSYTEILKKLEAYKDQFSNCEQRKEKEQNTNLDNTHADNAKLNNVEGANTSLTNDKQDRLQSQNKIERNNIDAKTVDEEFTNADDSNTKDVELNKNEERVTGLKTVEEKNTKVCDHEKEHKDLKSNSEHNGGSKTCEQGYKQLPDCVEENVNIKEEIKKNSKPKADMEEKSGKMEEKSELESNREKEVGEDIIHNSELESIEENKSQTMEVVKGCREGLKGHIKCNSEPENSEEGKSENMEEKLESENSREGELQGLKLSSEPENLDKMEEKSESGDSREEDLEIIIERLEKTLEQNLEDYEKAQDCEKQKFETVPKDTSELEETLNNLIEESSELKEKLGDVENVDKLQNSIEHDMESEDNEGEKSKRIALKAAQSEDIEKQELGQVRYDSELEGKFDNIENVVEHKLKLKLEEVVKRNSKLEEKLNSLMVQNKESETKEKEKLGKAIKRNSCSEDSEQDELESIIEGLEKIIEQKAETGHNDGEKLEGVTKHKSKEVGKELINPNSVLRKLQHPTQKTSDDDLQEDKSLDTGIDRNSNTKSANEANKKIFADLIAYKKPSCKFKNEKVTTENLKCDLRNVRLRVIRKYKKLHNRKFKKLGEGRSKAVETEDIRCKIKEQLELLRTRRMSADSHLIQPKLHSVLKFPQRNLHRLNTITDTLLRKLSSDNIKMLPEANGDSDDSDLEIVDSDTVKSERKNPSKANCNTASDLKYSLMTDRRQNKVVSDVQPGNSEESEKGVVLSNETDLMIISVVGGYKSPTPEGRYEENLIDIEENSETSKTTSIADDNNGDETKKDASQSSKETFVLGGEELVLNGIKPTKTTDVTKIKGWKNKKFAIAQKEGQKKPSDKLLQLLYDSESSNQSGPSSFDNETIARESGSSLLLLERPEDITNQTKSAFVSDELDQYLTQNSELNISYEIPKLEAEQTIATKYIDIKFPEFPHQNTLPSLTRNKGSYKPKTLAEKRKMLAEAEKPEVKDFMIRMSSKERKDYEESIRKVLNMRKKLIEEDVPFTRRCFVASTSITNTHNFVVYNGKRIKVPSCSDKEVITKIRERKKCKTLRLARQEKHAGKIPKVHRKRKPSLLSDLKTDVKNVSYDPAEWETVHMKLPRLTLEIKPQIGKSIDPKVEHLIRSDDVILARNRVEFALSTLKVKNSASSEQTFVFPLSYINDQTQFSLRRKLPTTVVVSSKEVIKPSESDTEIAETVNDVMKKMLAYIEISENTKDIIKDESESGNDDKTDLPKQSDNSSDKNWRRKKRRVVYGEKGVHRTTLEMKRLNCKIVSISLDEENGENKPCPKEFCKLGCICKSIECNSKNLLPSHCGLPRCMFECKCRCRKMDAGEKIALPAGTDIFSEGVINRLQDEAKKNLAKVEKEFTQTVIKTNNQIIMVGDSKARRRRATKMPKKYFDYVEEDTSDKSPSKYVAAESKYRSFAERSLTGHYEQDAIVGKYKNNATVKPCYVRLLKWDFSEIMPFCLVHSLYKCHCKNKAVFDSSIRDKDSVTGTYVTPSQAFPGKNKLKSKIDKTFNKEMYSSRTRGLVTSYYLIRNKSLTHKCKIEKNSKKLQKELEVYLRQNAAKILNEKTDESPVEVCKPPESSEKPKESKRKRKQSLIVLEDPGSDTANSSEYVTGKRHNNTERELKLQRRKMKSNIKLTGQELVNTMKGNEESLAASIFSGTKKLKSEFLALLGRKTSQLHLLPWTTLANRYNNGSFQLWYSNTSKICPLIITESGKRPTTHHYNIKLFEQMPRESAMPSEIIRWLITKKVPLEKSPENILLILSYNKSYWEICGLCEKKTTDSAKAKEKVSISLIDGWNNPENNSEATAVATAAEPTAIDLDNEDTNEISTEQEQTNEEEVEAIIHENLEDHKKVMFCSKRRFQPKKLISDEAHDDDDSLKIRQVLWAPIPSVTLACKWRVIYMNLVFEYLSLSRSSYTIKYNDIMRAMQIAHTDKTTIVLKSEELQKNYPHRNFGIYCVHNYLDKIFVGPYYLNENHDLDTLSFVNNVLVNTNLFNRIKGKNVPGDGRWFHQATSNDDKNIDDDVIVVQEPPAVVDLTCESDEDSSDASKKGSTCSEDSQFKNQSTLLQNMLMTPLPKAAPDSEEEIAKAERALDTLLKKGQINVNKTLVQLDSLNHLNRINSPPPQSVSNINSVPSKNTDLPENQNTSDTSYWNDDEDRLVIDEGREEDVNQEVKNETSDRNNANPIRVNRYLVTNVSGLGYMSAYQHENSKAVDVICPITQKIKCFSTPEAAIAALERVFAYKFIRVPKTFKIKFKMLDKLENVADAPLDRAVFHGYHIVGAFGVRNILQCSVTELENCGLKKNEITHIWNLFEQKLLWASICQLAKLLAIPVRETAVDHSLSDILDGALKEIRTLRNDKALFIREKIDLESKKVMLAEKCSKLQYQLPPDQRSKAQHELDRIVNFSNRQISSSSSATTSDTSDNSKPKLVNTSEAIELLDDDDDLPSNTKDMPKSNYIPVTAPMKFTLTKGTVSAGTSLLSGKKVERPSQRTRLTGNFKAGSNQQDNVPNKYFVVSRKRNASGSFVSATNTIDLSKCTFQIKPSNTEEKLLVKELPIKVRKHMLQAAANSALQIQQKPKQLGIPTPGMGNVVKSFSTTNAITVAKPFLSNIPTINKISRANPSVTQPAFTSGIAPKFILSQVSSSKTMNVVSSAAIPLTCVPVAVMPSTSKPVGDLIKTGAMATLTPVSKQPSFVLKNGTAKSAPNLIAFREGDNYKYFQLISEEKTAVLQPVQAIKRPASSVVVQPPLKKIAPATSLLMNQKTDK